MEALIASCRGDFSSFMQFQRLHFLFIGTSTHEVGVISSSTGCTELPVVICGRQLFANFMVIDLPNFEAVFGMDWLETFFATIDYRRRRVVFKFHGHPEFEFPSGDRLTSPVEYKA